MAKAVGSRLACVDSRSTEGKGTAMTVQSLGSFGLVSVIACLLCGSHLHNNAHAGAGRTFYVSPSGSDDHPGTRDKPFATPAKAQAAVRALSHTMTGDIAVVLRGGTYRLGRTWVLDHGDSGHNGHWVVYKAHPGETPVLSGGRRITGWQPDAKGRWKAHTSIDNFRQLYVNGRRATRARGAPPPNIALAGDHGYTTTHTAMADWANPTDIELCYQVVWTHTRCKVHSVTRQGDRAALKMLQPCFRLARTKEGVRVKLPQYIENAFELLDEPNEWYLNRATDTLYYIPRPGVNMAKCQAVAPAIERLVELRGTLAQPVHHIRFEGITFADATWLRPSTFGHPDVQANFLPDPDRLLKRDGTVTTVHNENLKSPSNIVCHAARSVRFERCTFTRLGSGGIDLEYGAQDNAIVGCRFHDISGTAIQVGDVLKADHHPADPRAVVRNNRVENNVIHHCCLEFKGGVGVFLGYTDGTVIAHNEIAHLPYSGVSVGWGWGEEDIGGGPPHYIQPFRYKTPTTARNNRIEHNHIHHVMQDLNDGGGVYTLSNQPGTVIRANHIHHANGAPGGIYLDEGSGFIEVTGNLVYGVRNPMNFNNRNQNRIATCPVHDNHFGVLPDGPPRSQGKVGKALLCDGVATYESVPHSPKLEPQHLTIEAWIWLDEFPTDDDGRRWIVNKNTHEFTQSHYALMIYYTKVGAYLNIGGASKNCFECWSAPKALALKRWHHVAMTYDGADLKAYLDGRPVATQAVNRKRVPGTTPLHIGRRQDGFNYFKGRIDEVRLYNRALSPHELKVNVLAIAGKQQPVGSRGLVAHWGFDTQPVVSDAVRTTKANAGLTPAYRDLLAKPR